MKSIKKAVALMLSLLTMLALTSCDSPRDFLAVMGQVLPFDISMKNVFGSEESEAADKMEADEEEAPTYDILPLSSDEQEMLKSLLFKARHMLINEKSFTSASEIDQTELLYFANEYFTEEGAPQPDSTQGGWTEETINGVIKSIFDTEIKNLANADSETGWSSTGKYFSAQPIKGEEDINLYVLSTSQVSETDHLVSALATVEKKNKLEKVLKISVEVTRDDKRSTGFYIRSIEAETTEGLSGAEIMATSQKKGYDSKKAGDGDNSTMWCEDADGSGKGESITFSWFTPQMVNAVSICNAAKSGGCRVKKLELTFSDGSTEDITLEDGGSVQFIRLSREIKTEFIKFTIKSVYGSSDSDYDTTYLAEITVY